MLQADTLMNTLRGARVQNEDDKEEGEHNLPKKHATKRWSSARKMDGDEGKLQVKNKY